MTSQQLSAIAGIVLSLAFFYIPGLNDWYNKQPSQTKSLIMLGVMVLTAAGAYGLACLQWFEIPITCDQKGLMGLLESLVIAIVTNQSTYTIVRKLAE
jgi:hypothetical protein